MIVDHSFILPVPKMNFRPIFPALCGLVIGLLCGYRMSGESAASGRDSVAAASKSRWRTTSADEEQQNLLPAGLLKDMAASGIWHANDAGLAALARLSAEQLESLASELKDDLLHPYQKEMREAFFRAWAAKDPHAAFAFVEALASSAMKEEMRAGILRGWAASDLDGYLGWVHSRKDGPVLHEAVRIAIPQLVVLDPESALGLTAKLPAHFRSSAYVDIFSSWILADPKAATKALEDLELPYRDRLAVQRVLAAGWVVSDPGAALAWASALPPGKQRLDTLQVLASVWAEKDPEAAIRHAETIGPGEEKKRFLESIVTSWPPDRIGEAFDFASAVVNAMDRDSLSIAALESWSRIDPVKARARVAELPEGPFRQRAIKALAMQMAAGDPKTAIDFARANLHDGKSRKDAMAAAIDGLAQRSPREAVSFISGLSAGQERTDAILSACRTLSDIEPSAATGLLELLPDGQAKTDAAMNLAFGMAAQDPEAAKAWAQRLPEGRTRTDALLIVTDSLMEADPAAAARWASSLADADGRARIEERIASQWAQRDPEAAIAWLGRIADPEVKSRALASAVEALAYTDPKRGLELALAEGAADPQRLHTVIGSLVKQWSASNLEEAIAQADQLKSVELQTSFVSHLLENVSNEDPREAAEILARFGNVPLHLDTVGNVVMNWARQDPASTAEWARGFADPELREVAVRNVVQEWATQSPEQAGDWLAGMPRESWRDQLMADFVVQIARDQSDLAAKFVQQIHDSTLRDQVAASLSGK